MMRHIFFVSLFFFACTNNSDPVSVEATPTNEILVETSTETSVVNRPTEFVSNTAEQETFRGLAFQALDVGDIDTAMTALLALRDTSEQSELRASGVLLLSELYNVQGQSSEAIELLLDLRTTAPPFGELEFILGRTYMETGLNGEAEVAFREAMRLQPSFLRTYLAHGGLLASVGRSEEAAEIFALYEQQVQTMAETLESEVSVEAKLQVIDQLGLSLPDDRLSAALGVALNDESLAIQAAAVVALAEVGTVEAIEALSALYERTTVEELSSRIEQAIIIIQQRSGE